MALPWREGPRLLRLRRPIAAAYSHDIGRYGHPLHRHVSASPFVNGGGGRKAEGRLILLRHGQSVWNVTDSGRGLTARFTGWADVPLSDRGREQAIAAGRALESEIAWSGRGEGPIEGDRVGWIDCAYTSLLRRATDTLTLALREMGLVNIGKGGISEGTAPLSLCRIPVVSSWRLNERHYGALVGLSKEGAERLYGRERLGRWRDSWEVPPPPMGSDTLDRWRDEKHCGAVTIVHDPGAAAADLHGPRCSMAATVESQAGGVGNVLGHPVDGRHATGNSPPFQHLDHRMMHVASLERAAPDGARPADFAIWEKPPQRKADRAALRRRRTDSPARNQLHPSWIPASESLRDTYERVLPLWTAGIAPRLRRGETVLVSAHANTLRSMLHWIDPRVVTREGMKKVKIPSAVPLVYRFRPADAGEDASEGKGGESPVAVPGGLVVIPPDSNDVQSNIRSDEPRHKLAGRWIETNEIEELSFCSRVGEMHLEHEIA